MTLKTKIFFFIIVGIAVAAVVAVLSLEKTQVYTLPTRGGVSTDIKIAVSPIVEAWVRDAAIDFNARNSQISVQIVPLKGLDATQQLDLSKTDSLPDAWIADAGFIREMARSVPYDETGLSVAHDGLVWLAVIQRSGLQGKLDWVTVHTAAVDPAQWASMGAGDTRFDAALPSPKNSVDGLAAFLSAAASYHQQPNLNPTMVADSDFLRWVDDIMAVVPNPNNSPLNQLTRPPVSVDVGIILQSQLPDVNRNQFMEQEPQYPVVFDFPYLIRRGDTTKGAADREKAAEIFRDFLLSADQQNRLPQYGLQSGNAFPPANAVVVDGATAERLRAQFK